MKLKFGISAKFYKKSPKFYGGESDRHIQYLESSIARWIGQHGAMPFLVPSMSAGSSFEEKDLDPTAYARELDALILQGGVDVAPELYGEEPGTAKFGFDAARDRYELQLIEAFLRERKPILGICRGFQLLNVHFGGTLQTLSNGPFKAHLDMSLEERFVHPIEICQGGVLSQIYGGKGGDVVSVHQQGVKRLADSLQLEAVSPEDGLVEAFSLTGEQFVLGVQWHPEFHSSEAQNLLAADGLFQMVLRATRDRRFFGSSEPLRKKKVKFSQSPSLTLGVELEMQILNPNSYELTPVAPAILRDLQDDTERIKSEIFQSMIEVETGICTNAHEAEADLLKEIEILNPVLKKHGVVLGATGTHPFAESRERLLTESPRYQYVVQEKQWIARRISIFGLHVHLGMESREQAIKFYRFYMALSPLLLGLSANSAFLESEFTGLASVRSTFFESMPTGGHPPVLETWDQFEGLYNKLVSAGAIQSHKDLWWDIRPSPMYGTLELRICDVMPTMHENVSLVAFIHLLGLALIHQEQLNITWPELSDWSYRENKWRAARYGLDFDFIIQDSGRVLPAREFLRSLLDILAKEADDWGYGEYWATLYRLIENGPPAHRQVMVYHATSSLKDVVRHYCQEWELNRPLWQPMADGKVPESGMNEAL